MSADGLDVRLVSTGRGRTTCAFFTPDGTRVLYASTHDASPDCPPPPDRSRGYVWPLHDYDLYTCAVDGTDLRRLAASPGYDAEATIAPDGRIVFTSVRDGDLDLYISDAAGGQVRRLTDRPGYDGGPFFSWDGRQIVWRAWHPTDPTELAEYRALLAQRLVRPNRAELFVMDADGTGIRQVTSNGAANWAPQPASRRRADRLLVEPPRPRALRLRALPRPPRRPRPRTAHLRGVLRLVPDVLAGRPPPGLLLEPRRRGSPRVQRLRRRLGRGTSSFTVIAWLPVK